MNLFGRQKDWGKLVNDPQTPFQIGRILGANEMAVALLEQEENETAKRVSAVLKGASAYFMEKDERYGWTEDG